MCKTIDIVSPTPPDSDIASEAWAVAAGRGLGKFDKAEGAFDDTPPSRVSAEHATAYRSAYWSENLAFAAD